MQFVFPQQKQVASQIHKTLQVFAESQGEIRPHFHLTPLQAQVAAHYQGGEFGHIETQGDAQNVGDGLFTFCINEAGDAGDKPELINMLNHAIHQLRSLVGELEDSK